MESAVSPLAETKAGRFTRLGLFLEHKKGKLREEKANEE